MKIDSDRCDNAFVVIFFKTVYNKTIILLDSVFVISGIIKILVSVSVNIHLDLDYSRYHRNLIQLLFISILG